MDFSNLKFLNGLVFMEATPDPADIKGLVTAISHHLRFPHSGTVIRTGRCSEDIREGDTAVVDVSVEDFPSTDHRYVQITVDAPGIGDYPIWCDPAIEPVLKDATSYREVLDIAVMNTEGRVFRFTNKQVIDFALVDFNAPEFSLNHPHRVQMLELQDVGEPKRLFYIVHEDHILFVMRERKEADGH